MDLFIYSDESGVFDKKHNKYFVFGGLVFLSKNERDNCSRLYSHAEKIARSNNKLSKEAEVKAVTISNQSKDKLFRSLNKFEKFGIIIHQEQVLPLFLQ